ncbi:MAG: Gfo/Idh/MocA family oxidoreductase, partial [Christensenella sp.]
MKKINVAVVGMNFGKEFVKLYQHHPNVGKVAICRRNPQALAQDGAELRIEKDMQFTDFDALCASKDIDAIHIITPIVNHYEQSLASLKAGKHTACTVPMATSVEELHNLCEAQKASGKTYMMMETSVYTREYLYV